MNKMKKNLKTLSVRLVAAALCLLLLGSAIAAAIIYVAAEEYDQSESTTEAPSEEPSTDEDSSAGSTSEESSSEESSSDEASSEESTSDESTSDESSSEDTSTETTEAPEVPDDEMYVFGDEDYLIRCAIFFTDETKESYYIRTSNIAKNAVAEGFELFTTTEEGVTHHIWSLYEQSVTVDAFGDYRIELPYSFISQSRTLEYIAALQEKAANSDIVLFPAYDCGNFKIRTGAYSSQSAAEAELEYISEALGLECTVAAPTDTSQQILNEAGEPVFDFDAGTLTYGLGLYPMQGEEMFYNKIPSGYFWPGIFEFKRYEGFGRDGITLVMIAELEDYVKSVIAWEIDPAWPAETVKAFTISARTFVINNSHERAKHSKYGVDICCDNCCQVSRGYSKLYAEVSAYVDSTVGQVLTCNGELITTYYNAVGGGCIVAGHEVWNQPAEDYLVGMMTPWEDYLSHKYGAWQFSASPTELLTSMRNAGYTTLKGSIADVKINKLCENSTYVYSVTVTDIYGTSVTINRNRNIRSAFEDYLYSGNFVIKHLGITDYGTNPAVEFVSGLHVMTGNGLKVVNGETNIYVLTGQGLKNTYLPENLQVKTSLSQVTADVMAETLEFVQNATYDESDTNFTFIGKGYGHGVGASQIGARDLGTMGYSYTQILSTYYPNTELVLYEDWLNEQ